MNLIYEKWDEILEYMRTDLEMTTLSFNTWIKPLKIHSLDNNTLKILVEMDGAVEYLDKKYKVYLQGAIIDVIDHIYDIEFVTKQQVESEDLPVKKSSNIMNEVIEKANLNPKYTFDTFVVGGNNKFAHAASLAVADKPGQIYNPLFLYGGVGLGKTHLMHSIAHSILQKDKNKKVLYVTSETFTYELIDAIRGINNTTINDFREKYRNIDVLLIDDVQFIASNVKSNIRELEGALNKLIAYSNLERKDIKEITVEIAEDVLRDILLPNEKREITPELIIQTVAEHYGITMADIIGNKRNSEIVVPRQIAMYLCRKMTDASLKNIGNILGKRDHTTIINGHNKIEAELKQNNTSLKNNIDIITKKINPM